MIVLSCSCTVLSLPVRDALIRDLPDLGDLSGISSRDDSCTKSTLAEMVMVEVIHKD